MRFVIKRTSEKPPFSGISTLKKHDFSHKTKRPPYEYNYSIYTVDLDSLAQLLAIENQVGELIIFQHNDINEKKVMAQGTIEIYDDFKE